MRTFSVEEAQRFVPFLLQTFEKVRAWLDEARKLSDKLEAGDVLPPDVPRLRAQLDEKVERIRAELARLEEAGIEVKAVDGLVDFRAVLDERQVYLCWKYPETAITTWHELDTGYAGRQPIKDPSLFAPTYLS